MPENCILLRDDTERTRISSLGLVGNGRINFVYRQMRYAERNRLLLETAYQRRREESMCGWLKDNSGLTWQVTPIVMDEMMWEHDLEQIARVTPAFLSVKKFDVATLQRAYGEVA